LALRGELADGVEVATITGNGQNWAFRIADLGA
jgi:hypothetical protein